MVHAYEFSEGLPKPLQVVCSNYVHMYSVYSIQYTVRTEQTVLRMCGKLGISDIQYI